MYLYKQKKVLWAFVQNLVHVINRGKFLSSLYNILYCCFECPQAEQYCVMHTCNPIHD